VSQERRRHQRLSVRLHEMDGFFRLHFNGEWHPLKDVHDVSISGMGIRFAVPINPGTQLKIGYMSRDLEINLPATVRWCRDKSQHDASTGEGYQLGVEFETGNINDNMLMFMAIRKFLDPFT
jgi:hypothetical protein